MSMLAVKAETLSKTYTGEGAPVTVFSGLSFELEEGVFAAIMGPSGVGKSTLLHLLGGIDRPDSGRVEVFGQSLEELSPRDRARFRNERIGFVFQFHHLLPEFTALENVAFPDRIAGVAPREAEAPRGDAARAASGSRSAGTTAPARCPEESSSASRSRALSRAARVCCWRTSPQAISTRRRRRRCSRSCASCTTERRMTTILVTHNPELAQRCDRLFTMSREGIAPSTGLPERG